MITEAHNGKAIAIISKQFGLDQQQTTYAIQQYLPILMQSLEKNFAHRGGLSSLLQVLNKGNYAQYYDNINTYTDQTVYNKGSEIMDQVFGSREIIHKIFEKIFQDTGVEINTLGHIMPLVTLIALSALYRKAQISFAQTQNNILPNQNQVKANTQAHIRAPSAEPNHKAAHAHNAQHGNHINYSVNGAHTHANAPKNNITQTVASQVAKLPQPTTAEEQPLPIAPSVYDEPLPNILVQAREDYEKRMRRQKFHPKHWLRLKSNKNETTQEEKMPVDQLQLQPKSAVSNTQTPEMLTHPAYKENHTPSYSTNNADGSSSPDILEPRLMKRGTLHSYLQKSAHQDQIGKPRNNQHSRVVSGDLFFDDQPTHSPVKRRKYVSLRKKLIAELPWYN